MAKLSRSVLKGIVKECMVEIMSEALFPMSNSQMQQRINESNGHTVNQKALHSSPISSNQYTKVPARPSNQPVRGSHLDSISYGTSRQEDKEKNKIFEGRVEKVANNMTSDPVLADILKDTALTTLQEQSSAENTRGKMPSSRGDQAARAVSANDPVSIFGAESASKWAQLAFADNVGK